MKKSWRKKLLKRLRAVLEAMGVKFENQLPPPEERTTHLYYAPHSREPKGKNNPLTKSKPPVNRMQNK